MRLRTSTIKYIFIILMLITSCCFYFIPFNYIKLLPNNIEINYSTIYDLNKNSFGPFVTPQLSDIIQTSTNSSSFRLDLKLFNLITVKSINLEVGNKQIMACGDSIGFSVNVNGLIVIGSAKVQTENGFEDAVNGVLQPNDIITKLAGEKLNNVNDISKIINKKENLGLDVDVEFIRDGEIMTSKLSPKLDKISNEYKLGIWVKDDACGIGTLTYINPNNNRFGALGHAVSDSNNNKPVQAHGGNLYKSTILGIKKASKGTPGEIKGLFVQGKNFVGEIDSNTQYGIFGNMYENSIELNNDKLFDIGGRLTAKAGKAQIYCNVDGMGVKPYNIEIIKTNYQHISNEKSMVIKVTDSDLLEKTGGIIQGMSGSPIVQNGKIIGAVTHVFVSDPTKGFGIYLDWMINN